MSKPKKTIFLIVGADEPALFFSSIEKAEQYLEAIDVEAGVYSAAYGVFGDTYRIVVEHERVVIRRDDMIPHRPDKVRELLLHFLSAADVPVSDRESLPKLLELCAPYLQS